MRKKVILVLALTLVLGGCGGNSSNKLEGLNAEFKEYKKTPDKEDQLKEVATARLEEIGVEQAEFYGYGNMEDLGYSKHIDVLFKTSKTPVIVNCHETYDWYASSVRDASDEKYYFVSDQERSKDDIYDYKTGELIFKGLTEEELLEKTKEDIAAYEASHTEADKIETSVRIQVSGNYDHTTLGDITVNDDLGKGEGYIVLVNLTWDFQNPAETAKKVLKTYSDDLAATLAKEYDSINEIAVIWSTPQQSDKNSKWSYECRDGGAYLSDTMTAF